MINIVVEGESDREAAKAVVRAAGQVVGIVRASGGKTRLDPKIAKYSEASKRSSWVVFRDSDGECPVDLRDRLMATVASNPRFALRIAHSMTESWLPADADGFAEYFGVRPGSLPNKTEELAHPKQTLLQLCAKSSSRTIRAEVVTHDGKTGPLYVTRINDFASTSWNPTAAAIDCPSLARALARIRGLP